MNKAQNIPFMIGLCTLCLILIIAVFADVLAPYNPYQLGIPYQKPSPEHILGTNDVGQDILSEMIYGTRVSLLIGITAAFITTLLGTILGLIAGYLGGPADKFVSLITGIAMALPSLVVSILLAAFLSASLWNIILAICITAWTHTTRIVRSRVRQISSLPFVKVEKAMGAKAPYIMVRHILPNASDIIFSRSVLAVANAMLTEASLSFLGMGVIGQKSWGGILHYAFFRSGIINGYWWWYGPPILFISLSVIGFTLLGYYNAGSRR
jgi:peptide/nickel transport system permease protein